MISGRLSVRARLTAWYVVVTAVFLTVFGAVTYALLLRALQRRVDASLVGAVTSFEQALQVELATRDPRPLAAIVAEEVAERPLSERPIAVFRITGDVVTAPNAHSIVLGRLRPLIAAGRGFVTLDPDTDDALRVFAGPVTIGGQPFIVVVGRRLDDQIELLEALHAALMVGIPLWVAFAGVLGYWLVRKTLQPVAEMSEEAAAIGASDVTRRIPVRRAGDELGQLASTFNALLDRVRAVVAQQRRFMADTSHELRTPLSIVRGEAEVALSKNDRSAAELRESLIVIEQESRLLSSIIDDLFLLARADAGQAVLAPATFYLDELMAETIHAHRSLAAKKSISISAQLPPETVFRGDERLLRRMLVNLIDNAVKYTPFGGRVEITLALRDGRYVIDVADSGTTIAAEERTRIFERFQRGNPAASEGAGLGLPIAQSIAELHGGRIVVMSGDDGEGNIFRVELPM